MSLSTAAFNGQILCVDLSKRRHEISGPFFVSRFARRNLLFFWRLGRGGCSDYPSKTGCAS